MSSFIQATVLATGIIAAQLNAPAPKEPPPPLRRAVIFEPCATLFGHPLAHSALEQVASERFFALERLRADAGIDTWLALLADPPAALYMHTVTNREVMAVACYADRRSRDFALEALASNDATRALPVQPWHYHVDGRDTYLIGYELTAVAEGLRDTETIVYLHREADPRVTLETQGFRLSREHEVPQPPVNHFVFVKRFFRQWLVDPNEKATKSAPAHDPPPAPNPALHLWPEVASIVLPIGEVWITLRNSGSVPLVDLELETVAGPELLQLASGRRLPKRLRPGSEIDLPLKINRDRPVPAGHYLIPYAVGANLNRNRRYEKYGRLEVVVGGPPLISAPSSVEYAHGEAVEIMARDAERRPIHLEAMLPRGIDLRPGESGMAELRFSGAEIPGVSPTHVTLLAWAGDDRHTARIGMHEIEIVGGDLWPTPWIVYGAYAVLLVFLGFVYVRERLAGRRDRRRRA